MKRPELSPEPWGSFVISCYELSWALDDLVEALDPHQPRWYGGGLDTIFDPNRING